MVKNQIFRATVPSKATVWVAGVVLVAGMCGCGGDERLASVSGRVTVNGQPVEGLTVTFTPLDEESRPSSGTCDGQGHYQAMFTRGQAGATVGRNQVSFSAPFDPETRGPAFAIPAEYGAESTREFTVTTGRNTHVDFDLEIP